MDLSDKKVLITLSEFCQDAMRSEGMTVETLAVKVGYEPRTLTRSYLPGKEFKPLKKMPETSYNDILGALNKTHEDFKQYYISHKEDASSSGTTQQVTHGNNSQNINKIEIAGGATLNFGSTLTKETDD